MTKQKNLSKSSSEYSVCRSDIRGVDFSDTGSASSKGRAPYMQNLYIDYDSDREHILESVPGFRRVFKFRYKINAMHLQKISEDEEFILLHAEKVLYRIPINERRIIIFLTVKESSESAITVLIKLLRTAALLRHIFPLRI